MSTPSPLEAPGNHGAKSTPNDNFMVRAFNFLAYIFLLPFRLVAWPFRAVYNWFKSPTPNVAAGIVEPQGSCLLVAAGKKAFTFQIKSTKNDAAVTKKLMQQVATKFGVERDRTGKLKTDFHRIDSIPTNTLFEGVTAEVLGGRIGYTAAVGFVEGYDPNCITISKDKFPKHATKEQVIGTMRENLRDIGIMVLDRPQVIEAWPAPFYAGVPSASASRLPPPGMLSLPRDGDVHPSIPGAGWPAVPPPGRRGVAPRPMPAGEAGRVDFLPPPRSQYLLPPFESLPPRFPLGRRSDALGPTMPAGEVARGDLLPTPQFLYAPQRFAESPSPSPRAGAGQWPIADEPQYPPVGSCGGEAATIPCRGCQELRATVEAGGLGAGEARQHLERINAEADRLAREGRLAPGVRARM